MERVCRFLYCDAYDIKSFTWPLPDGGVDDPGDQYPRGLFSHCADGRPHNFAARRYRVRHIGSDRVRNGVWGINRVRLDRISDLIQGDAFGRF